MDPLHCRRDGVRGQDSAGECGPGGCPEGRPPRARRCLLKGCERWFEASHPQARYCSAACRQAASRWRRWQASRRYRSTPHGREKRRAQSRRYRERRPSLPEPDPAPDHAAESCEGQRAAGIPEDSPSCPCARPGCYVEFACSTRSPLRRFCSSACRQALRRVSQRERRWRARRRRGVQPRRWTGRGPPAGDWATSPHISRPPGHP